MSPTRVSLQELRENFKLYAELCLKIVNKRTETVPFELNYCQAKILEAIQQSIANNKAPRLVVLKARQVGVSTLTQALLFWKAHLFKNRTALVLAHKIESAEGLFQMSKRFYEYLPDKLKAKKRYSTKRVMHFETNDSRLQVEVAGEVRGYTAQFVHLSELAFYDNPTQTLTAILQTVPNTLDSLVIVESTPNGAAGEFYDLWKRAVKGQSDFTPIFIPWWEEPGYRMATSQYPDLGETDKEQELLLKGCKSEQLAWRRWCIQNNCGGDPEVFEQEYASDDDSCFLSSGRPVYNLDGYKYFKALTEDWAKDNPDPRKYRYELVKGETKKDITLEQHSRGRYRIYAKREARKQYVIGIDPSSGDPGSDPTPMVVVDRHTLDVVAVYHDRTPPEILARECAKLAWYYNEALVVGEANNHGILFLYELRGIYDNLYFRPSSVDSVSGKVTDRVGWLTTAKTREHIINVTRHYVNDKMGKIQDSILVDEFRTMVYKEGDKAEHADNCHDDCIFSFGMALEAHKGMPDAKLEPLSHTAEKELAEKRQMRRAMGLEDTNEFLEPYGMTVDELQRYDDRQTAVKTRRESLGLGEEV